MFSAIKLCRNCGFREFRRTINKSGTDKNSDVILSSTVHQEHQNDKMNTKNSNMKPKWSKQGKYTNFRGLSTIHQQIIGATNPPYQSNMLVSKEESRDFMAIFPDLVRDLTEVGRNQELPEVMKRFAKVLQYNTPRGKKNRGLMVVSSYKLLEDPDNLTPEKIKISNILGWCVEMLQSNFLLTDDIMDNSQMRRGAPCWYLQPGINLSAINDALMIESAIYTLLKRNIRDHPMYITIIELFHDATLKTSYGQSLDLMCLDQEKKPLLDMFTMNRYTSIVKYKTAYYSFYLPVALAMFLANMNDFEQHRQAKTILLEMGQFFQIQDDFLDCFGDPLSTGKKGRDIEEGKCSWLVVMALQRASSVQKEIIYEHYGRSDSKSVEIIKKLYEDLCLPNTYSIYEEESYNLIKTHIQQISKGLRHDLFFNIMEKLYKRES